MQKVKAFTYTELMVLEELIENAPFHRLRGWVDDKNRPIDDPNAKFWELMLKKIKNLEVWMMQDETLETDAFIDGVLWADGIQNVIWVYPTHFEIRTDRGTLILGDVNGNWELSQFEMDGEKETQTLFYEFADSEDWSYEELAEYFLEWFDAWMEA